MLELRIDRLYQACKGEDGFLTGGSFVGHVDELARRNGVKPDDDRPTALRAALVAWWEQLQSAADTDGDGQVSRAELGVGARSRRVPPGQHRQRGAVAADPWIDMLYAVIDADFDASIPAHRWLGP